MASKKGAEWRVKETLRERKEILKLTQGKGLWEALFPNNKQARPDWTNRQFRAVAADRALTIAGSDEPMLELAFKEFELDPADPFSWRYLLTVFAEAHYNKGRKRGAKPKWNSKRWLTLLADFREIKDSKPSRTEGAICKLIISRFGSRYKGIKASTLRRQLINARDPDKNELLREAVNVTRQIIETELLDRDNAYRDSGLDKSAYEWAVSLITDRAFLRDI